MANLFSDLILVNGGAANISPMDDSSWMTAVCPRCSVDRQFGVIARDAQKSQYWLRCQVCRTAMVYSDFKYSPGSAPFRTPKGTPPTETTVWEEARACLSVGANTAAVMLCRKLLLHLAVTHGLPENDAKGKSPTFAAAVDHLQEEGIITRKMRPWVDRIRDVGNVANHEIEPVSTEAALDVAGFTEQLLRLAFEMDALMAGATETPPSDD